MNRFIMSFNDRLFKELTEIAKKYGVRPSILLKGIFFLYLADVKGEDYVRQLLDEVYSRAVPREDILFLKDILDSPLYKEWKSAHNK